MPGLLLASTASADPGTVDVSPESVTVTGAPTTLQFPVTRGGDTSYDAWLSYQTADGTALDTFDYSAAAGVLHLPAGENAFTLPVNILGSSVPLPDKTFTLQLIGATGAGPLPAFAAGQAFAIGSAPRSVTTADLNGDGKADLITANTVGNNVSVRLNTTVPGTATATFSALQIFTTGNSPQSVTTADLNGDGKADLITANTDSGNVSVLLNMTAPGAATPIFAAKESFAVGSTPSAVTAADLNGDGKADLIVANEIDNDVSVLLNTALPGATTPAFAAQQVFATGFAPRSVTTADVNGDGVPDLIAGNIGSGSVSVLLNSTAPGAAAPAFAAQQSFDVGGGPTSVAAADVNGDGKPDLIAANGSGSTVSVLTNTTVPGAATPAFAPWRSFGTGSGPASVVAQDVNADGKLDLVTANEGNDSVSVLLNATAPGASMPGFAPQQSLGAGAAPRSVTAADLNADGLPGLVAANFIGNDVSVLLNETVPGATPLTFAAPQSFATERPHSVAAADVNGDGKPDLIAANQNSNTVSVLLDTTEPGAIAPTFAAGQIFTTGLIPYWAIATDVNGDGKPDLVTANVGGRNVSVLLNTTAPGTTLATFAAHQTFATGIQLPQSGPAMVIALDVNGDGRPDLITANLDDDSLSVLLNTTPPGGAAAFATQVTFALGTGSHPEAVTGADVNGDGKLDLITTDDFGEVSVRLNTTATGATAPTLAAVQSFDVGGDPTSVTSADVNGDGRPDLIVTVGNLGNAAVLLNTTPPGATVAAFASQQSFAVGSNPDSVAAADLNGDARLDVITGSSDDVSVLLNTTAPGAATPAFTSLAHPAAGATPRSIVTADVNGDSKPDLIVANDVDDKVSVLLNTQYAVFVAPASVTGTIQYSMPVVQWGPAQLDFGSEPVGGSGANRVITLVNDGNADLIIGGLSLGGGDAADYAVSDNCPAGLPSTAGSNSCDITISFTPSAPDTRNATLTLTTNAPAGPESIDLTGTGIAPVATDITLITHANTSISATLPASYASSNPLTFGVVQPAHGTATLDDPATGAFTYTPGADYTGADSFTFTATDVVTGVSSNSATVSIDVHAAPAPGNVAPVAGDLDLTTYENQPLAGTLPASDANGDALTFSVAQPAHGTVTLDDPATGAFTYTPASGYTGADSFTFTASDGALTSNTATVGIDVNATPGPGNVAPVAVDASLSVYAGQTLSAALAAADGNGDALAYEVVTEPANGTVTVTDPATGAFTYAPAADYTGPDSFTFTASDGVLTSNTGTVRIEVLLVPAAPFDNIGAGGGGGGSFGAWALLVLMLPAALRIGRRR